jgi:hypothetical protein
MKRRGICRHTISLLGILIAILFIAVSAAHAEWTVVTPPNVSSDWGLAGVQFISSAEGWAVGQDLTNKKGDPECYADTEFPPKRFCGDIVIQGRPE